MHLYLGKTRLSQLLGVSVFFSESLDSISTVQKMSPGVKIIFWDLGLDSISARKVGCSNIREIEILDYKIEICMICTLV